MNYLFLQWSTSFEIDKDIIYYLCLHDEKYILVLLKGKLGINVIS